MKKIEYGFLKDLIKTMSVNEYFDPGMQEDVKNTIELAFFNLVKLNAFDENVINNIPYEELKEVQVAKGFNSVND
jgi:hypothetical protein